MKLSLPGEGSVPGVKQRIKNMKRNFAKNVVEKCLAEESLTKLVGSLCKSIKERKDGVAETTREMVAACGQRRGSVDTGKSNNLGAGQRTQLTVNGGLSDKGGERVHRHPEGTKPVSSMCPVIPVVVHEQSSGRVCCVEKRRNTCGGRKFG